MSSPSGPSRVRSPGRRPSPAALLTLPERSSVGPPGTLSRGTCGPDLGSLDPQHLHHRELIRNADSGAPALTEAETLGWGHLKGRASELHHRLSTVILWTLCIQPILGKVASPSLQRGRARLHHGSWSFALPSACRALGPRFKERGRRQASLHPQQSPRGFLQGPQPDGKCPSTQSLCSRVGTQHGEVPHSDTSGPLPGASG